MSETFKKNRLNFKETLKRPQKTFQRNQKRHPKETLNETLKKP